MNRRRIEYLKQTGQYDPEGGLFELVVVSLGLVALFVAVVFFKSLP